MLYVALGIIGATTMPQNLFLHSGVMQARAVAPNSRSRREAIGFAIADSGIALTFALAFSAAILILAAAAFDAHRHEEIAELSDANRLITPILDAL